jgi:hypothetical protein
LANLGSDEWAVKAYVGCEFRFRLEIRDALADPADASDTPYPLVALLEDTVPLTLDPQPDPRHLTLYTRNTLRPCGARRAGTVT